MASYSYTFTSGDTVTPTKLNNARTVSDIVNADIKSDAAIVGTKILPNFGAQDVATTGTATAAKLIPSGTSATGNGLYLPATNTLALSTNGAERLRVDADGNAAIGTTSTAAARFRVADNTANAALLITQTGSGNALVVEDSDNPDSTPTVIDASGNVVVGHTAAPTLASVVHPLNVVGVGAAIARAAADAFGSVLTFVKSRSTTIGAARAIVQNNDELGAIEFAADNGANLNVLAATISAECDGTPGSADMPGRIVFRTTADGAASPTERMRITNAGNVGIGKTPTTALDVNGTVTATAFAGPITGTASAIADSTVTNAKVATGAAIAHNKLANITAGQVLMGNASNVPTSTALSGDVTVNSSGVTAIGSGVIVDADIKSDAAIAASKLAATLDLSGKTVTLPDSNISTEKIADAAVTPAKLSRPYTLRTAQNSTSGTSIDFTGIPSWARRITIMFDGVSTNGMSAVIVQVGDGSVVTSGYLGSGGTLINGATSNGVNRTNGFALDDAASAGATRHGAAVLTTLGSNRWVFSSVTGRSDGANAGIGGGSVTLSGALDRVRVTTVGGANTFDAGVINIAYE